MKIYFELTTIPQWKREVMLLIAILWKRMACCSVISITISFYVTRSIVYARTRVTLLGPQVVPMAM